MRIFNLFHADGQIQDGSMFKQIPPKLSSSAVQIVSTHSGSHSRISPRDTLTEESDSTNQLSQVEVSIAIQVRASFKHPMVASLTPTSK